MHILHLLLVFGVDLKKSAKNVKSVGTTNSGTINNRK